MLRKIFIQLTIIILITAGIHICIFANDQGKRDDLLLNFDKMKYDDSRQKYYEAVVQSAWKAAWIHDSGDSTGIYINISSGKKSFLVPVAPCWYLDSLDSFKANDKITVFGAESVIGGRSIILPKLIKISSGDIWLRNYDGKPFWVISSAGGSPKGAGNDGKKGPGGGGGPGGGSGGGHGGGPGGGGGMPNF